MSGDGNKPMGCKAYGSIPHMVGSRRSEKDYGITEGMQRILTEKTRDRKDTVLVTEKLDGSCCAAYREPVTDNVLALTRAGWLATTSPFVQHHMFAEYVRGYADAFRHMLKPGERAVGEWLAQAHGTRYEICKDEEPFAIFDIMYRQRRLVTADVIERLHGTPFGMPPLLHCGGALSLPDALEYLMPYGRRGAVDPAEGVVYRVERDGEVDFLAKYVRPDKADGRYLPEISGGDPVWNWKLPNWVAKLERIEYPVAALPDKLPESKQGEHP